MQAWMKCPDCGYDDYHEVWMNAAQFTTTWTCESCETEHVDFDDLGYHFAEG